MKKYKCHKCEKSFSKKISLHAHQSVHNQRVGKCKHCGEKKIAGIQFSKDSPYYNLCKDIEIVPRKNQVIPHKHEIKSGD